MGDAVFDGVSRTEGLAVVVDDDVVVDVCLSAQLGPDVEVVELPGSTIIPGLVDCHVHFALWALDPLGHQDNAIPYLCATTFRALEGAARAGWLAIRDPGGLDAGFKEAVDAGLVAGPRIQTSVVIVSPINGISDGTKRHGVRVPYLAGMPNPECTGPVEARAKVREVIRAGADFIKVATTGGVSSRRREPTQRLFTDEEIAAIVDEAHAWGRRVACHAIGGSGVSMAVEAGVDSIEHGVWLDDEVIAEMARRGTWYVPTLAAYESHLRHDHSPAREWSETMVAAHRDSFRRAREAGVRIAAGSDGGVYGYDPVLELELMAAAGMTSVEVLAAATSQAALCLGWESVVGSIRPGAPADFVVVPGDPTEDLGSLRDPAALIVIRAGKPLARDAPG